MLFYISLWFIYCCLLYNLLFFIYLFIYLFYLFIYAYCILFYLLFIHFYVFIYFYIFGTFDILKGCNSELFGNKEFVVDKPVSVHY